MYGGSCSCGFGTFCLALVGRGGVGAPVSPLAMGISADVGVFESLFDEEADVFEPEPSRRRAFVPGDSWGARWDLRLARSSMLTAHSWRSTGVRFAACRKASLSC